MMSTDREILGTSSAFSEVLEARIEAGEGVFEEQHPFLRTALRGLAQRLHPEVIPMGFVMATELYVYDINTGKNGFTGEPMPSEVTGMPPIMGAAVKLAAGDIAREAFGQDFADAVSAIQEEARAPRAE